MNYKIEQRKKMFFIGVPIETSNENGRFHQDVPPLWDRFFREEMAEKIPNRINQDLLAVYTHYHGDYTKPFTYLIGCEVKNLNTIPQGMKGVEIEAAPYAVFTAKGEFPQSMMKTWQAIWNSPVKRSYTTDFEQYRSDFNPQESPEVNIHIAINDR